MLSIPTDGTLLAGLDPTLVILVVLFVTGATEFLKRIKAVKLLEKFVDEPAWFVSLIVSIGISYVAESLLPIKLVEAVGHFLAACASGLAITIGANVASRLIPEKKKKEDA